MIVLKIGRGMGDEQPLPNDSGTLDAEFNPDHATWTLEQLGRHMAKQLGIVDGELQLTTITFNWGSRGAKS
jgi:hypothetical protein